MMIRRRWAHQWRTFQIFTPTGEKQDPEQLYRLAVQLWSRTLMRGRLSRLVYGQPWLTFEKRAIVGAGGHAEIQDVWAVPQPRSGRGDALAGFVREEMAAYWPGAVEEVELDPLPANRQFAAAQIRMRRPVIYGLAKRQIGLDLAGALGRLDAGEAAMLQFLMFPLHDGKWRPQAQAEYGRAIGHSDSPGGGASLAARVLDGTMGLATGVTGGLLGALGGGGGEPAHQQRVASRPRKIDPIDRAALATAPKILQEHGFEVIGRILATAATSARAGGIVQGVAAQLAGLDGPNQVRALPVRFGARRFWRMAERRWPTGEGSIWTCSNLVNVIEAPGRQQSEGGPPVIELKVPPPAEGIRFCDVIYRGRRVPFLVPPDANWVHWLMQGVTGSGKGVLQLGYELELAKAGLGFAAFWPLRQDAERMMAMLPEDRLADVIYIEVGHARWVCPLNLLAHDGTDADRARTVEQTLNLFIRLFGKDAVQERSQECLRGIFWATAAVDGHLGTAYELLMNEDKRLRAAAKVPIPEVRIYLQNMPKNVEAPRNKIFSLVTSLSLGPMVTASAKLDWQMIVRTGKILVVNLNQEDDMVGDLGARLVAGAMLNQLTRAAKSIRPDERQCLKGFLTLCDEIMIIADENEEQLKEIGTQMRQFRFGLGAAGQYPSQLSARAWDALKNNAKNKVVLQQADPANARELAGMLGDPVRPEHLLQLPALQGYGNLQIHGVTADGRQTLVPTGPVTIYCPPFTQPLRGWDKAAEESMARWLQPRTGDAAATESEWE